MEEKLKRLFAEHFGIDPERVRDELPLAGDDLQADSLDMIDLAMTLEFAFKIEICDETLEHWKTYGDVRRTLLQKAQVQ